MGSWTWRLHKVLRGSGHRLSKPDPPSTEGWLLNDPQPFKHQMPSGRVSVNLKPAVISTDHLMHQADTYPNQPSPLNAECTC